MVLVVQLHTHRRDRQLQPGQDQLRHRADHIRQRGPQVNFLSPDDTATISGSLSVSGTASDDNQVASLYYSVAKTADPAPSFPGDYTLLVNQKYAFNFTVNTTLLSDKTAYKIYLVAVDGAGNDMATAPAAPKVLNINVDQDSNRPIVKLSNIDADGLPSLTTLKMSNTVFGSVTDDDGTPVKLEVDEDGSTWTEITMSGGTVSYDSSAGDGTKTLYFRVTDKNARVFATNAAASGDKPRVENGAPGVYIESTVSYRVDTNFPDVFSALSVDRTSAYDFADGLPLITNMSFGGATGVFKVRTWPPMPAASRRYMSWCPAQLARHSSPVPTAPRCRAVPSIPDTIRG